MGFFGIQSQPQSIDTSAVSIDFLHRHECTACPLNRAHGLRHPKIKPSGTQEPLIYMLGEAPGETEDREGEPFVGDAGRVLRLRIPNKWKSKIRMGNVIRCRPPKNRDPAFAEIECCRPFSVQDIEQTKPTAIFGFGNVPLNWILGETTITNWNGRRVPVKIGNHVCWYFPIYHPSYVLRSRRFEPRKPTEYGSDSEFIFAHDLKTAFAAVEAGLPAPRVYTEDEIGGNIEIITGCRGDRDLQRIAELLRHAATEKVAGLDYETKRLRPYADDACLLSAAVSTKIHTFAFPFDHPGSSFNARQRKEVYRLFSEFLHEGRCLKVAHNLAFEMEWSAYTFGNECLRAGYWHDTLTQAYILDERPGHGKCHSLRFLTIQYFGFDVKSLFNLDKDNLDKASLEDVLRYNGPDARTARMLHFAQHKRLRDEGLLDVYHHALARVPTVVLTQIKGVPVDPDAVDKLNKEYTGDEETGTIGKIEAVEERIAATPEAQTFRRRTGKDFRPSANKDVLYVLRNILGKPVENTDETALESVDHPFARLILEYRGYEKTYSTYIKPLLPGSSVLYSDGLLHPILSTTKTRTWRTSSEHPNSQNYPKRKNRFVRRQIKHPDPNIKVVSFDFAGIQARNVAMESGDRALVHAFNTWYDIHADWLERIARIHPKWIVEGVKELARNKDLFKDYRSRAKNEFVFPSFFGAQAKAVSGYLGIPIDKAERAHEEFWDEFPDIKNWHVRIKKGYELTGYVTGLSGFRRRGPISPNELINAPIQADESLIVCGAMNRLSEREEEQYQANLEIHDDLTFFWPKNRIDEYSEIVIREMCKLEYDFINVPLVVERSIGDDWASVTDAGVFESVGKYDYREVKK